MPYNTREKRSRYMRERYQLKKEELKDYQRSNRNLFNKIKLLNLKGVTACEGCGEDHPAVLQFHHRDPGSKTKSVMQLVGGNASWMILKEEVDKCDVLCANCHKLEHNNWSDEQIEKVQTMIAQGEVAIKKRKYKLPASLKDWVTIAYEGGESLKGIADQLSVNPSSLHSFMVKHEIPRRTSAETRKAMKQIAEVYRKGEEDAEFISDKDDT